MKSKENTVQPGTCKLCFAFIVILPVTFLAGCATTEDPGDHTVLKQSRVDADKLLPVDCLLPAQIRKLGNRVTYLAPGKVVKTTAPDCEIRGGRYAAYD